MVSVRPTADRCGMVRRVAASVRFQQHPCQFRRRHFIDLRRSGPRAHQHLRWCGSSGEFGQPFTSSCRQPVKAETWSAFRHNDCPAAAPPSSGVGEVSRFDSGWHYGIAIVGGTKSIATTGGSGAALHCVTDCSCCSASAAILLTDYASSRHRGPWARAAVLQTLNHVITPSLKRSSGSELIRRTLRWLWRRRSRCRPNVIEFHRPIIEERTRCSVIADI